MRKYTLEKRSQARWLLTFNERNIKGEEIAIEIIRYENSDSKTSLPGLWKKQGLIDRILKNYWFITVFATDKNGICRDSYNPQIKMSDDNMRQIINFDWMLEATNQNLTKIIKEVEHLAFT